MKTITKKILLKKLEEAPNNYEMYMNYDVYMNDPIEDCIIDHNHKRIILI